MIELLVDQLDHAFDKPSWHGANLMASLRGLKGEVLTWRPQPGRNNIAELAVHTAYWKYRAFRLISDAEPHAFGIKGTNFIPRETVTAAQWQQDLELMRTWHAHMRAAVAKLKPARLNDATKSHAKHTVAEVVMGVAAHDLYHAGQIQLVKRLFENR